MCFCGTRGKKKFNQCHCWPMTLYWFWISVWVWHLRPTVTSWQTPIVFEAFFLFLLYTTQKCHWSYSSSQPAVLVHRNSNSRRKLQFTDVKNPLERSYFRVLVREVHMGFSIKTLTPSLSVVIDPSLLLPVIFPLKVHILCVFLLRLRQSLLVWHPAKIPSTRYATLTGRNTFIAPRWNKE